MSLVPLRRPMLANLAAGLVVLGASTTVRAGDHGVPVDPEALAPLWRPVANPEPLPPLGLPSRAAGCAVVAFTIDPGGRPREAVVVAAHPEGVYGEAARRVIEHRRYVPGRDNAEARPVATFEIVTFGPRQARTGSRLARAADPALFAPCDLRAAEVAVRRRAKTDGG
jgi:hypothetical protein